MSYQIFKVKMSKKDIKKLHERVAMDHITISWLVYRELHRFLSRDDPATILVRMADTYQDKIPKIGHLTVVHLRRDHVNLIRSIYRNVDIWLDENILQLLLLNYLNVPFVDEDIRTGYAYYTLKMPEGSHKRIAKIIKHFNTDWNTLFEAAMLNVTYSGDINLNDLDMNLENPEVIKVTLKQTVVRSLNNAGFQGALLFVNKKKLCAIALKLLIDRFNFLIEE